MKRYYFQSEVYSGVGYPVEWDGQSEEELYVKAEEAEALEQLNKEMLEVLDTAFCLLSNSTTDAIYHELRKSWFVKYESIITKAEEE